MPAQSRGDRVLRAAIVMALCVVSTIALIPLISVASISLSSRLAVESDKVTLWPVGFTLASWSYMLGMKDLWRAFAVTAGATLIGVSLALFLNIVMAYALARKEFSAGRIIIFLVVVSMIFKAPLVPYFLTLKNIGLYNNPLVLIVPQLLNEFNLMIMVTFMRQFPAELEEAAMVEGCGYFRRLFSIVMPLSRAPLATLGMFYAVVMWNQFQHPLMFLQKPEWYPLQIKIRQMITSENAIPIAGLVNVDYNMATLQAVAIVFAIIPILLVYPFLQKHFTKGALVGSVKG